MSFITALKKLQFINTDRQKKKFHSQFSTDLKGDIFHKCFFSSVPVDLCRKTSRRLKKKTDFKWLNLSFEQIAIGST